MRGVKAEGGWAVVSTQECDIHPTSDILPFPEARLWDDRDLPGLALMAESVHRHGALAAIELTHHGPTTANYHSRETPMGPAHEPVSRNAPVQARVMDKADIRDYRRWHRAAALRARKVGFDIIYCYAGHNIALPMHFLQKRRNQRTDEYGGSLENRVRLLREIIEDTKEAVATAAPSPCASPSTSSWAKTASPARARVGTSWPCWPNCRTCGTSTSATGTTTRSRPASPTRAIRKSISPS